MVGHEVRFPEYENWLDRLKEKGGGFPWIRQERNFPMNTSFTNHPRERTLDEIKQSVLESSRVMAAICSEALARGCDVSEVRKEAEEMIDVMAHKFSMNYVKPFGLAVAKVFDRLFDGIYVNSRQVEKVRSICHHSPVVFMPSHRTYLDFLLLSLVCFEYEIPLPAIAAGMDFMNSAFMGAVLRRNGAFFMRRSFGKDMLYWAVFSEYVQTHIVHSDRPVEFFGEGTRSRVGKSLHPKYGLLQIVMEPYLRGAVYDMVVVPVSMNYDKILEEMLYAYELLGFPKPKESTSGLFKAREILDQDFGKCFITFGEPISVRDYFGTTSIRSSLVCQPDSQFVIEPAARESIQRFAHRVVVDTANEAVITVWPLAAMAMLMHLDGNDEQVPRYSSIHRHVASLILLMKRMGIVVNVAQSIDHDLKYYLRLHSNIFHPFAMDSVDFDLHLKDLPVEKEGAVARHLMERGVSRLVLTTYANGMMHAVYEKGFIACIVMNLHLNHLEEIEREYLYMMSCMRREFVYVPGEERKSFEKTVECLRKAGIIFIRNGNVEVVDHVAIDELRNITLPYINQLLVCVGVILNSNSPDLSPGDVIKGAQKEIVHRYETSSPIPVRLSFLSTEPIKNVFNTLVDIKALSRKNGKFVPDTYVLRETFTRLYRYVGRIEGEPQKPITVLEAKL